MNRKSDIILGIDPGTLILGYGILKVENKKAVLLEMGILKLAKHKDPHKRLQIIYNKVCELNRAYKPTQFAIEAPFFGKNVQSMLKLGRAQGVCIAASLQHGVEAIEYSPKKVKQAVTGNGNANKEQVWKMLQQVLGFKETPEYLDATDALAVAFCHYLQIQSPLGPVAKNKGWDDFLKNNAHRIKKS